MIIGSDIYLKTPRMSEQDAVINKAIPSVGSYTVRGLWIGSVSSK